MKLLKQLTLPLAGLLLMSSCAMMSGGSMVEMSAAFVRNTERVADRHDIYVMQDDSMDVDAQDAALLESAEMRAMVGSRVEVSGHALEAAMLPVLDRHDAYVYADPTLDALERDIYVGSSGGLKRVIAAAKANAPTY